MTKTTAIDNQILNQHAKGLGRRKIAAALGVSEWKVRCVVRDATTAYLQPNTKLQKTGNRFRVKKVKKTKSNANKAIILSDIHIPFHDKVALGLAMEYMKDAAPTEIVLNGDIIDFYGASSYRKDPTRIETLQDEINETYDFLRTLRSQHEKAKIYYVQGNHENRLARFILDKAPELYSLHCLSMDELFKLSELDITYVDESSQVVLGDLEIIHGTICRSKSAFSAKAHHDKTGGSVLIGHVHRLGTFYHTNRWGTHISVENGYLGSTDFDYVNKPDWQQGFTEVSYMEDGRFTVRQHHINNGTLIVDDVVYSA